MSPDETRRILEDLDRLGKLRDHGVISEDEFRARSGVVLHSADAESRQFRPSSAIEPSRTGSDQRFPWGWVVLLVIGVLIAAHSVYTDQPGPTPSALPSASQRSSSQAPIHADAAPAVRAQTHHPISTAKPYRPKWRMVEVVRGEGMKTTETFRIRANQWMIDWNTGPGENGDGNFAIMLHTADGSGMKLVANVIGKSRDHTVMHGTGAYYLEIMAGQPYAIIVSDYY